VSTASLDELGVRLGAADPAVRRSALDALNRYLRADDGSVRCTAAKLLFVHFRAPLCRHIRCELARRRQAQPLAEAEAFHSRVETHVNSALLRLLARLEKGPLGDQEHVHFLAYLKAIVRNTLTTRSRQQERARRKESVLLDELGTAEPSVVDRLSNDEERQRREQTFLQRSGDLKEDEQRLLELYRSGLTYREIADRLGGSAGQYRAKMGRILQKLR
jgi:RNA polymerase sigma factor (sigma-70 family)